MKNKLNAIIKALDKEKADSLLISFPPNITYLSGFKETEAYLLLTPDRMVYFTNPIYAREAAQIKSWQVHCVKGNIFRDISRYAKKLKIRRLGFEAKSLPFLEHEYFQKECAGLNIELVKTIDIIEKLRAVKSEAELASIRRAAEITQEALAFARELLDERCSEKQLQIEIEKLMRIKGDNSIAFPTIVAFGKNSSDPHHSSSLDNLGFNNLSLIDLGAKSNGYCADLTRVFFLGKMPTHLKKVYDLVRRARDAAIKKIKDGVRACDVDNAARKIIDSAGYGKYFGHGVGHGVGLCVHEMPFLQSRNESKLKENMVVTIEPAVYLPDRYGIRLESMVIVKQNKGEIIDAIFDRKSETGESDHL